MSLDPILLVGGSGVVGRQTARWLRERRPELPLLIGGRNPVTAAEVATLVGGAQPVVVDSATSGLGLAQGQRVSAVVMLAPDDGLHGLKLAQGQGVPYLTIVNGVVEVAPELAFFAHHPSQAPIIFASHWLGGAATFLAIDAARHFDTVTSIRLGSIIDDQDLAGPTALEDMERVHDTAPAALAIANGRRTWLINEATDGTFRTIDGRTLDAKAFSTFDTASLYALTGAPDIRFDLATGASSSRLGGGRPGAEIVVDVEGEKTGQALHARSTLSFEEGLASLTGLCVALLLSPASGQSGRPLPTAGVLLPELLWEADAFLDQLSRSGVVLTRQDPRPAG
ncbi:hypothetical protein [Pseudomonas sp. SLFW]|uniref:hypothetical protein n=1 Tax=Pseudomonas sp. SLFW TaxID=2683259 RepID=UPI0014126BB4|nr:hypothetical protein [Pseudomonas sp. SLFW]NBB13590.1 hypothetical protein [Pseudomonas sp. SLFW]